PETLIEAVRFGPDHVGTKAKLSKPPLARPGLRARDERPPDASTPHALVDDEPAQFRVWPGLDERGGKHVRPPDDATLRVHRDERVGHVRSEDGANAGERRRSVGRVPELDRELVHRV